MRKRVTILLGFMLLVLGAQTTQAQEDVTIREINAIPQAQIDQLNALGADLTGDDINDTGEALIFNELLFQNVRFTAVVLSDPLSSGRASVDADDGLPGRIHVFVRDTSAAAEGMEGMTLQLVDGDFENTGLINVTVGDVITVTGEIDPFFSTMQVAPTGQVELIGDLASLGLPETLLDPVVIDGTDLVNMQVGEPGQVQPIWDNLASLRDQYVRIEGATVLRRSLADPDRPDFSITTDGGNTVIPFTDTSIRFRNDRDGDYPDNFNIPEEDFVPPPPGSRVNIQGFVYIQFDDPFANGVPDGVVMNIAPWEDSDLEVTETPPQISDVTKPDFVPSTEDVDVSASVAPDPTRMITNVTLRYFTSASDDTMSVAMADNGDGTFTAALPAQADGTFVVYWIEAEDSEGALSESPDEVIRFLQDGIDSVEDVQLTFGEDLDASPFEGVTTAMDLTATVQSDPGVSGFISIQDDPDQAPWTGIIVDATDELISALERGDQIRITEATVAENFGVTELRDITFEEVDTGDPIPDKVVTTDVLQDPEVAEAHEGMRLRFDGVVITAQDADAPQDFGEFLFSTQDLDASLRSDDASDAISEDFNNTLNEGDHMAFLQGIWWYSFGNYKLIPESMEDIGTITDTEDEEVPGAFALRQNYPNPFNPVTTIEYTVPVMENVRLEVFDLLGRSVAVLVDGQRPAGTYTLQFDARELASGLYLYRLEAGSSVQTKKMLLLK